MKIARVVWLERLLLAAVFAFGMYLRWPVVNGPFDRQFDGFQGAFFATCAINYSKLGLGALDGYPVANMNATRDAPEHFYPYANHPPLVPLLAYASAATFGPRGWDTAWQKDRAPQGLEPALRWPFFLCQLATLVALFWLFKEIGALRAGLFAGALFWSAPLSVTYAGLVNYEHPSLAALLVCAALLARFARRGGRMNLIGASCAYALACAVTFAPVFFWPFLTLAAALSSPIGRRLKHGLATGATLCAAAALPLAAHGFFAARALEKLGLPKDTLTRRAKNLLAPLLDGSLPLSDWLAIQWRAGAAMFGLALLVAALLATPLCVARLRRSTLPIFAPSAFAFALLAGGACVQLGFYRHTAGPQETFLLNLLPGMCAVLAIALVLQPRPRATRVAYESLVRATTVVLEFGMLALLCSGGFLGAYMQQTRMRAPGPLDDPPGRGPLALLPQNAGDELHTLLPANSVGWYPTELGFNTAVFYYAWRHLLPVTPATYGAAVTQAQRFGLADAPVFLVLPKHATGPLAAAVTALESDLERTRPGLLASPSSETSHFKSFALAR